MAFGFIYEFPEYPPCAALNLGLRICSCQAEIGLDLKGLPRDGFSSSTRLRGENILKSITRAEGADDSQLSKGLIYPSRNLNRAYPGTFRLFLAESGWIFCLPSSRTTSRRASAYASSEHGGPSFEKFFLVG